MEYLEKIGLGTLNNHQDQVELRFVHLTRDHTDLINFVFPNLHNVDTTAVILATLNNSVDSINNQIIAEAPGLQTVYR